MNIVFFGSDNFATVSLEHILKSSHTVVGCVTQPDAHQGRGLKVVLSPIKILAVEQNIDYIQPETLKDPVVAERLKAFDADLFVVVAYGRLLTKEILNIPKKFCINVHGSLLPKYRGAAPIHWAILNGDQETGVTIQKMVLALDAGDIIAQQKMPIPSEMGADQLRVQMAGLGAELLVQALDQIAESKQVFTAQDASQISHAPKLTKDMGLMDWNKSAQVIFNQIRGLKPWPGTHTHYQKKMLKILSADIHLNFHSSKPGTIISIDKNGFSVACGHGVLQIKEVQPEAGKPMPAVSFIVGHHLKSGQILG